METNVPRIIAHRGWAARCPENTLTAFRRALKLPIAGFECDVRLTADGIPVILHDRTLDRTTDGRGPVKAVPFSRLRRLNAAAKSAPAEASCPIPSLDETVELYASRGGPPGTLDIEVKPDPDTAPELVDAILPVLDAHPAVRGDILITSFDEDVLDYLRRVAPQYARGLLVDGLADPLLKSARRLECSAIAPNAAQTDQPWVERCHAAGLGVAVWTVNDESEMRRVVSAGVDWLITDAPDVALRVVGAV